MDSSATASTDPPIRIGIAYLMLWTAGSALLLAMYQLFPRESSQANFREVQAAGYLIYSIVNGMAVASLPIAIYRNVKGWRFPLTAGHWVLVLHGVVSILQTLSFVASNLAERLTQADMIPSDQGRFFFLASMLTSLISSLGFATLLLLHLPLRWKVYALLMAANSVVLALFMILFFFDYYFIGSWFSGIASILMYASLIPLLVCLIKDIREPTGYDSLHWAGLVVAIMGAVMYAYWTLAPLFLLGPMQ